MILDLSPLGHQPMPNRARTAWIAYNGEVYNYLELMEELKALGHVFSSRSDTEVILAAYDEWGTDCLRRFNGMWAFALWDSNRQRLFCARDRFGVKPFYYVLRDGVFTFASEIKALFAAGAARPRPRADALYEFLTLGFTDTSDGTCFEDVFQLPASHFMEVTRGGARRSRWWNIEPTEAAGRADAPERFRDLFFSSVELRLRSDVPVGTCLSGGLDSSSIVGAVTRLRDRIQTFSIYYAGDPYFDEREYISEVTRDPRVEPRLLDPTALVTPRMLRDATYHQEEPVSGSSPISQYFVMKLAKDASMRVLLDGQGGDEVLGGYLHFLDPLTAGKLRRLRIGEACRDMDRLAREQGYPARRRLERAAKVALHAAFGLGTLTRMEARLRGRTRQPFTRRFLREGHALGFRYEERFPSRLSNVLYNSIFVKSLPQLLRYEDRNSMAFSIEARVPFLDYRIVEFAFSLPDEWKIRGAETKRVLREGLRGVLPEKIRARKDKRGFVTPGDAWLRGPLRDFARETFASERFGDNGVLDAGRVREEFEAFVSERSRRGTDLWRYLSYAVWLETFIP
jgi:asparagine synthase (glutamine-hydrolysing)